MELPLISVIVPIYKVEPYFDKCISSIVNQTYTNLEIILVDDGSPDQCPQMCDAWAEKDARIRVIHQKNQGSGTARNIGLDAAKGEVIAFVDSDDYIAPDMYMHLSTLLEQGADIAECNYIEVTADDAVFEQKYETCFYTTQEAMKEHIHDRIFRQLIWNKVYRRKLIENVRFPNGKKIDDEFFTYKVLGNAKVLAHSSKICYAYRQQMDSIMHVISETNRLQAVEAKIQRHAYIKENFPALENLSAKDLWFTCIYQGQMALRNLDGESAKRVIAYLEKNLARMPLPSCTGNLKETVWLAMSNTNLLKTCKIRNTLRIGL